MDMRHEHPCIGEKAEALQRASMGEKIQHPYWFVARSLAVDTSFLCINRSLAVVGKSLKKGTCETKGRSDKQAPHSCL